MDDAYNWEEERQEQQQPIDAGAAGLSGEGGAGGPTHPLLRKGQADKAGTFALPRRVLLPWKVGLGEERGREKGEARHSQGQNGAAALGDGRKCYRVESLPSSQASAALVRLPAPWGGL